MNLLESSNPDRHSAERTSIDGLYQLVWRQSKLDLENDDLNTIADEKSPFLVLDNLSRRFVVTVTVVVFAVVKSVVTCRDDLCMLFTKRVQFLFQCALL